MAIQANALTRIKKTRDYFLEFAQSQQFAGILLIICTVFSISISNSLFSSGWLHFIHSNFLNIKLEWIVNDVFMSFFFLLVGLEIRRQLLIGELSSKKTAALPIAAALGGMLFPALIFILFNLGSHTLQGWAIPTATDIAFVVGILNLLGNRVPTTLKVFITALAVVDDLGAVLIIAIFYSNNIDILYLILLFAAIPICNYLLKKTTNGFYFVYAAVGILFFTLLHHAHLHTTLAGVILAAITPYNKNDDDSKLNTVEHHLNKPVNYFIIPLFALFNTAIVLECDIINHFDLNLFAGIFLALVVGKPIGITLFSWMACKLKLAELPKQIEIEKIFWVSILGGIGFTMSIFISLLAFKETYLIEQSKLIVLIASSFAAVLGFVMLKIKFRKSVE
jgi:NhaA family Na+:H+ antiporter